jgi:hypothetical protein
MLTFRNSWFAAVTLLLWGRLPAAAQQDSVTHFIIGATYNSGLNYYGRVDSLQSKAFYPFVGLSLKDDLYLNATFVFIHNGLGSQYAATLVEGGYNFKNKQGNWSGNLSASRYFYQADISLVQSAVKEVVAGSISNLNNVLDITLGVNAKFSDRTDIGLQGGLDHIIRIPHIFGDGVIVLDPSGNIFAGTQNFTQTYYEQKNLLIFPVSQSQVAKDSRTFNILAYELSLPLVYGYKKLNLILSPAYVLPQHLLTVAGQPDLSERGSNLLYVTATVKFTL